MPHPSKVSAVRRRYHLCFPLHPDVLNKSPFSLMARLLLEHVCDGVSDHRFYCHIDHRSQSTFSPDMLLWVVCYVFLHIVCVNFV